MGSALSCFTKPKQEQQQQQQHQHKSIPNIQITPPNEKHPIKKKGATMTALHNFVHSLSPRSSMDAQGSHKDNTHSRSTSTHSPRVPRFSIPGRDGSRTRSMSASSDNSSAGASGFASGKASKRTEERRARKEQKAIKQQEEREKIEERRKMEDQLAMMEEDEETQARYGLLTDAKELLSIEEVQQRKAGDEVTFRARIHHQRNISKHLDFLLFREQTHSIQGVLQHDTSHFVKWVQRLEPESLVQITGTLQEPPEPVRSATFTDLEIKVYSIHLVNPARDIHFDNYDPPETTQMRLQNRILDLRHPANQALFRIRSMITRVFRQTLEKENFIEIQTPKLQPAATESGAEVFKVNYFGRRAFLAQSPQLAKQMTVSADFKKVFEVSFSKLSRCEKTKILC